MYFKGEKIMESNSLITLSQDEKTLTLNTIQNYTLALDQLYYLISDDTLTHESKETLLNVSEHYMSDISKALDFDSLATEKIKKRFAEIRTANERIQELEKKLATNNPFDNITERLEHLSNTFKSWWKDKGFSYVRESSFNQAGFFEADLGFHMSRGHFYSETPETDKQVQLEWLQNKKEEGYQIYQDSNGGSKTLIDCPENRELLTKLFKSQFQSVELLSWNSRCIFTTEDDLFELVSLKIIIRDTGEIANLP